ncbi:hypothetical protein NEMIN01_1249 [Nematocida minor]|uniref:uncharacterized protein n=1 Tax=Nematocida minor TaxID=1912983 RepID=UPI002220E5E3|nr:uncharacterized protein NEMIN01_1249 [Nematocida minor]KAI5190847.1 hypothetical protein NEMIN01_1249 [Nematocida minor]
MNEAVTSRTKYLEVSQELRNRIVNIYTASMEHKRKAEEQTVPLVEEIDYKGISQDLGMIGVCTDEVKYKIQDKLAHLEEIRDYVKEVTTDEKDQRKAYLSDIIKREIAQAEDQLSVLEEKMRSLISRGNENVLQTIQTAINRLSKKMEHM